MTYRQLIKRVQLESGFSDVEAKDALQSTVECIAVHLTEGERKDFASQLPQELQEMALAVMPTEKNSQTDLLEQMVAINSIPEDRAKKQLLSAWSALKRSLSPGEIDDIRAQLPNPTVALLH